MKNYSNNAFHWSKKMFLSLAVRSQVIFFLESSAFRWLRERASVLRVIRFQLSSMFWKERLSLENMVRWRKHLS